jgi:hypothetical protein
MSAPRAATIRCRRVIAGPCSKSSALVESLPVRAAHFPPAGVCAIRPRLRHLLARIDSGQQRMEGNQQRGKTCLDRLVCRPAAIVDTVIGRQSATASACHSRGRSIASAGAKVQASTCSRGSYDNIGHNQPQVDDCAWFRGWFFPVSSTPYDEPSATNRCYGIRMRVMPSFVSRPSCPCLANWRRRRFRVALDNPSTRARLPCEPTITRSWLIDTPRPIVLPG